MEHKAAKEAFVSNLTGTTMREVVLVSMLVPAAGFLRGALWGVVCRYSRGRFAALSCANDRRLDV